MYKKQFTKTILLILFIFFSFIPLSTAKAYSSSENEKVINEMCEYSAKHECITTGTRDVLAGGEVVETRMVEECIDNYFFDYCQSKMADYDFVAAINNKEDNFCGNLKEDDSYFWNKLLRSCREYYIAKTENYYLCKDDVYCLQNIAIQEKNISVLDYLNDEQKEILEKQNISTNIYISDKLFSHISETKQCDVNYNYVKASCVHYLVKNNKAQHCILSDNRYLNKMCFTDLAKNQNNLDYCYYLNDSGDQNYCIRKLAIKNRNPSICNATKNTQSTRNKSLSDCKSAIPLDFNKNQIGRMILVFLAPLLVLIFTIMMMFQYIPRKFKIKLFIITIIYLGGYVFWIYKMINYVGTDLMNNFDISNILVRIFYPIFWFFSLTTYLLHDAYFLYFIYALIQFIILFVLFFWLPHYFYEKNIETKKRWTIITAITIYVVLAVIVNLLPFLFGPY